MSNGNFMKPHAFHARRKGGSLFVDLILKDIDGREIRINMPNSVAKTIGAKLIDAADGSCDREETVIE